MKLLKKLFALLSAGCLLMLCTSCGKQKSNILAVYYQPDGCIAQCSEYLSENTGAVLLELTDENCADKYRGLLSDADILFVGFPLTDGTAPDSVLSFFEKNAPADKAVCVFVYSPDGKTGSSLADIGALCPKSQIVDRLVLRENDFEEIKPAFEGWYGNILFW